MKVQMFLEDSGNGLKLDPRTKLLLVFIINIVLMGGGITGVDLLIRIGLALIPFLLLMKDKKYKEGFAYFIVFSIAAAGEGILINYTQGIWNLLTVILTGLVSRFLPSLVMGYYLVTTTSVSEFVASMERMHITKKIVIPMSVMFRFFPTIMEETNAIGNAMKMRGISMGGTVKNPFTLLEYKVVPLMMSIVKIGDELSAASLTKGLGNTQKRTNICKIGFNIQDYILASVVIAGFVLFVIF